MSETVTINSVDDIEVLAEGTVEIPRGDKKLRIPIRALSWGESKEIVAAHKDPSPPRKMHKGERGKPEWYLDETDPVHIELCDKMSDERTVAMALASITIEGLTEETLLKKFSMGDVNLILSAVNEMSNITPEQEEELKKS